MDYNADHGVEYNKSELRARRSSFTILEEGTLEASQTLTNETVSSRGSPMRKTSGMTLPPLSVSVEPPATHIPPQWDMISIASSQCPDDRKANISISRRVSDALLHTYNHIKKKSSARDRLDPKLLENDIRRYEVEEIIMKAHKISNEPQFTLEVALAALRRKKYVDRQFVQIQNQTGINYKTLQFSPEYEKGFAEFLHKHAAKRVRYCTLFGLFLLPSSYLYDTFRQDTVMPGVLLLRFLLVIPALFALLVMTYQKRWVQCAEWCTSSVILLIAFEMVFKKILEQSAIPLIPLFILLVPVFGITRMRFVTSTIVGCTIVFMFLVGSLASGSVARDALAFQSINYIAGLFIGMVAHYRQEVLRRRNYALCLPFMHRGFHDVSSYLQNSEKFRKRNLLNNYTLKFKESSVEEIFYKYWYLIDPFPFEHTSAAVLHKGVFRAIQYAVGGAILTQVALSIQDLKYTVTSTPSHPGALRAALILRYGVVVPCYGFSLAAMFFFGRRYVSIWRNSSRVQDISEEDDTPRASTCRTPTSSASPQDNLFRFSYARMSESPIHSPNYVRTMQRICMLVIVAHAFVMATILFIIASGVEDSEEVISSTYFLGFLNSILFAHRSGFRLRFFYASLGTIAVASWFVISCWFYVPEYAVLFTTYTCTILFLGMMISYEEESLRRKFFILRSLRMLEFSEWFQDIRRVPGWIRQRLKRKAIEAKERVRKKSNQDNSDVPALPGFGHDAAKMGEASKFGMYTSSLNIVTAVVSELVSGGVVAL